MQAIGCIVAVVTACMWLDQPLGFGLVLGAIAAATAPSTTIMITRKYRSDGPLTNALLSVVAIDDAVCILLYAIAVAVARALPDGIMSQSPSGGFRRVPVGTAWSGARRRGCWHCDGILH